MDKRQHEAKSRRMERKGEFLEVLEVLARPGKQEEGGEAAAAAAEEGKRSDVGMFLQNVIKGRKQSRRKAELLLPPLSQLGPV